MNQRLFDWKFFVRFIGIYIVLYYGNLLFWGIIDPKNYYSPFADKYLNYISLLITSVFGFSSMIIHFFGVDTIVDGRYLFIPNGTALYMDQPCLGLGVMFFWIAFIFAAKNPATFKIKWAIIGVLSIWLINCARVTLLFFALEKNWAIGRLDAHDMFNYAAYVVIALLIWLVNINSGKLRANGISKVNPEKVSLTSA